MVNPHLFIHFLVFNRQSLWIMKDQTYPAIAQHLHQHLLHPPPTLHPPPPPEIQFKVNQLNSTISLLGCRFLQLMLIIRQPPAFQYRPQMNCTQYANIYVCH